MSREKKTRPEAWQEKVKLKGASVQRRKEGAFIISCQSKLGGLEFPSRVWGTRWCRDPTWSCLLPLRPPLWSTGVNRCFCGVRGLTTDVVCFLAKIWRLPSGGSACISLLLTKLMSLPPETEAPMRINVGVRLSRKSRDLSSASRAPGLTSCLPHEPTQGPLWRAKP